MADHTCEFCKRNFARSDVRRLHYKKCRARISRGAQIPQPARRGRKTRSCDSCALSKRGCDQRQPCSDCTSRGSICTYTRAPTGKGFAGTSAESAGPDVEDGDIVPIKTSGVSVTGIESAPEFISELPNASNSSQWLTHSQSTAVKSTSVLAFLRNFTSSKGIATGFQYSSPGGQWQQFLPENFMIEMPSDALSMLSDTSFTEIGVPAVQQIVDYTSATSSWLQFDSLASGARNEFWNINTLTVGRPIGTLDHLTAIDMVDWIIDPLFPKSREILMRFRKIGLPGQLAELASASPAMSLQSRQCLQFFSPPNIRRLIEWFWNFWYPHCPIIHFSTFNLITAPAPLVIAMVLLGAVASPASKDKDLARRYFDLAERIAFEDFENTDQCSNLNGSSRDIPRPTGLQTTFLICCLQNWEGDSEASARARRDRFSTMVNVSRVVVNI
ncbi:hypothetical protein ONS95_006826 [Cadophora gregata]|uniref:uncharacterized protein n=1 Tax=Cadophora gregata TaxID=51156 RepID=UPI0026DD34B3|nr:uncharacterized protein ONS95_006826 [Cadophora gregata]KAK0101668.1 hypothetical protein ONS95_006826 [Cadophora gregata]